MVYRRNSLSDKHTKDESEEEIEIISIQPLSPQDKALLKFGEHILIHSIDSLKDFSKTMITLITSLFAVYFVILKFLGVEDFQYLQKFSLTNYCSSYFVHFEHTVFCICTNAPIR